jgi:hypothetical protein
MPGADVALAAPHFGRPQEGVVAGAAGLNV